MMQFAKDRDEAFIAFVMNDDVNAVRKYCLKWNIQMPQTKRVMAGGVYKAVQYCTNIPEEVKNVAMQKCLKLGMSPFINWEEEERK